MSDMREALREAIEFQNEDTECLLDHPTCPDGRCKDHGCMVMRVNRWRAALSAPAAGYDILVADALDHARQAETAASIARAKLIAALSAPQGGKVVGTFDDYAKYSVENWDGYGAAPITPETIAAAKTFTQLLHLPGEGNHAPGGDGTIGFEWVDGNRRKLFVDIGPGDAVSAYMRCEDGRCLTSKRIAASPPPPAREIGEGVMRIEHDGFEGTIQGSYVTREGKRGVVLQQVGTRVVHVYGERWLAAATPTPPAQGGEVVRAFLDKVHEVLCRRFPRCRECADWNGTCPHSELPCDLTKVFLDVKAMLATSPPPPTAAVSRYGDPSLLVVAVDAAINGIECGSSSAPVLECLKAAREQFLAQPPPGKAEESAQSAVDR